MYMCVSARHVAKQDARFSASRRCTVRVSLSLSLSLSLFCVYSYFLFFMIGSDLCTYGLGILLLSFHMSFICV